MLTIKSKDAEPPPVASSLAEKAARLGPVQLRQMAAALLDSVSGLVPPSRPPLSCPVCQWILFVPVTLSCGHTTCRACIGGSCVCPECGGCEGRSAPEANVLLKAAVAKWWAPEAEAARVRAEGDQCARGGSLERALEKYNIALRIAPTDHLVLEARSDVLLRLNRSEDSLSDAIAATRLRPFWPKGYYRRGVVLSNLGKYEDALLSFSICAALQKNAGRVKCLVEFTNALQRFLDPSSNCKGSKKRLPLEPWWSPNRKYPSDPPLKSAADDEIIVNFSKSAISTFPSVESRKLHLLLYKIFDEIDRMKNIVGGGRTLVIRKDLVESDDFECVLCCRSLWRPVTTPCGHTYCSTCLDRCLDYSPNCPLCMTSLSQYLGTMERNVTEFLEVALAMTQPEEYTLRLLAQRQESSKLAASPDIPMFVCTTAFPTVPCPLFVFEPRYRLMIRQAIMAGGRFGIAACVHQHNDVKRFADYGTLLEIQDVVMLSDGCSILSNVGIRRFQVTSRSERDGYDTAQVQYLVDDPVPEHALPELTKLHDSVRQRGMKWFSSMGSDMQKKILGTFGAMPELEEDWSRLQDGPAWAWWLLAILPLGQHLQIGILGTTCLEKRLKAIDKTLKHFEEDPQNVDPVSKSADNGLKRGGSAPVTPLS
ncbi:ATP-dependent protease La (LON) domain [Nesidiocoris tenuis]|uniref:ATP-dependent protease La (LON) domain n=1 Tax=Nesidiocoris tenuis TaxID=355587 RepID=A0ABN7B6C4_9HEMI|nr:ATP-dependent protease La (LON) domain [Nesidiocoris tenuis]